MKYSVEVRVKKSSLTDSAFVHSVQKDDMNQAFQAANEFCDGIRSDRLSKHFVQIVDNNTKDVVVYFGTGEERV